MELSPATKSRSLRSCCCSSRSVVCHRSECISSPIPPPLQKNMMLYKYNTILLHEQRRAWQFRACIGGDPIPTGYQLDTSRSNPCIIALILCTYSSPLIVVPLSLSLLSSGLLKGSMAGRLEYARHEYSGGTLDSLGLFVGGRCRPDPPDGDDADYAPEGSEQRDDRADRVRLGNRVRGRIYSGRCTRPITANYQH